jgi:glycosyltransferase involved in cell wall biosynthesis
LARRIFCVTPKLKERLATRHPSQAGKADVLTVSVDTGVFCATPFDLADGKLRLVYAGRLDEFKDPALMFRVAKRVHEKLGGAFEFHYCGASDPHRFAEFAAIEPFAVLHGALMPDGVAAVMRKVHMGILVSHWEGMPCFLLELLSSGRPFGGLRLPQFDQVVKPGISGRMVERAESEEASTEAVARVIVEQWYEIKAGRVDPRRVHEQILPFSADRQLELLFAAHRLMQRGAQAPSGACAERA